MPVQAENWRKAFFGGETQPQLFECTDGRDWVLKLPGNPHGGDAGLCADWIGTALALLAELPVLECSPVPIGEAALSTIPTRSNAHAWARSGTALGTVHLVESMNVPGSQALLDAASPAELAGIVVVDSWLDVLDRKKPLGAWNLLLDTTHDPPRLRVIDYGLALTEVLGPPALGAATMKLRCPGEIRSFLHKNEVQSAIERVGSISDSEIDEIIGSIPADWLRSVPRVREVPGYLRSRSERLTNLFQSEGLL